MKRPKGPSCRDTHQVRLKVLAGVLVSWWCKYTGLGPWTLVKPDGTEVLYPVSRRAVKECDVERPKGVSAAGLPSLVEREMSATLSLFPVLNELLSNPNWSDATPKGKLCLMVFTDEVSVRVLLKLETDKLKTSTVGRSLDDALAVLEKLLATAQVIWEQDAGYQQTGKKKGK